MNARLKYCVWYGQESKDTPLPVCYTRLLVDARMIARALAQDDDYGEGYSMGLLSDKPEFMEHFTCVKE